MTPAEAKALPIQQVVACPQWQAVRLALRGRWAREHPKNVAALRAYMQGRWDDPLAVRRVLNVLTGSVHRCGHTAGQAETDQLRYEVRLRWAEMLGNCTENIKGAI